MNVGSRARLSAQGRKVHHPCLHELAGDVVSTGKAFVEGKAADAITVRWPKVSMRPGIVRPASTTAHVSHFEAAD